MAELGYSRNSYTDKAVTNGTLYTYTVQAVYTKSSGDTYAGGYSSSGIAYLRLDRASIVSVKGVTNSSYKKARIKWSKNSVATGYEIKYKVGSKTYKKKVKGASKVKATVNKLSRKKTAKIYVRSYKNVNGVKYYSAWSKVYKFKW